MFHITIYENNHTVDTRLSGMRIDFFFKSLSDDKFYG